MPAYQVISESIFVCKFRNCNLFLLNSKPFYGKFLHTFVMSNSEHTKQNKNRRGSTRKETVTSKSIQQNEQQPSSSSSSSSYRGPSCNSPRTLYALQGQRTVRYQESIVQNGQTICIKHNSLSNTANLTTLPLKRQCCRQKLVLNPCSVISKPHSALFRQNQIETVLPNYYYSQKNLYSAYFHRDESDSRNRPERSDRESISGSISEQPDPSFSFPIPPNMDMQVGYVESLRTWQNLASVHRQNKPGMQLTVMCYNVLAQDLLSQHSNLYRYHNRDALSWAVRWNNLFNEIKQMNADILCLQEVQESHLKSHYKLLESLGYNAIYKKRTGYRIDGCAIYYKSDKFNLVDYATVEYYQNDVNVLNRDNVAVIAKFSLKNNNRTEFVVSTTHLLYNPRRQDVRLAQVQVLFSEIDRLAFDKSGKSSTSYVPVIITGDLNSKPESAVYKFISTGKLKYENLTSRSLEKSKTGETMGKVFLPHQLKITDYSQHEALAKERKKRLDIPKKDELTLVGLQHSERTPKQNIENNHDPSLFSSGTIYHNFPLQSVYKHKVNNVNEGTTYQGEWITVDYIFYSGRKVVNLDDDRLKLLSRYRLPLSSELTKVKVPNGSVGSDHLSLIAKFYLEYAA